MGNTREPVNELTRENQVLSLGLTPVLVIGAGVYWIMLGGTDAGSIVPILRALNAVVAGILIVAWIRGLPTDADALDRATLAAVCCVCIASAFSPFPRAALDGATAAMAWGAAFYVARRIARSRRNRRFALDAVGAAGLAVTLLFTILWGAVLARWFAVDASVPPLPLALPPSCSGTSTSLGSRF